MKNYFIANGEVLNTNMGIEEMESRVQESLDENTSGMAQFRVKKLSEKEVRFFFDADMALITGLGIGAFQLQAVGGYPMIHPLNFAGKNFYTDITAFIRFYKFQLFEEMEQLVEHIGLRCYSDRILMQIVF